MDSKVHLPAGHTIPEFKREREQFLAALQCINPFLWKKELDFIEGLLCALYKELILLFILNLFPRAAGIKYHKPGGLEQWECVISWSWMLEV